MSQPTIECSPAAAPGASSDPAEPAAAPAAGVAAAAAAAPECFADALLLLLSPSPAAKAALSLLPASPGPLLGFEGPLLDLWFLGFEVACCRQSLTPQQVQQRLQGALEASSLGPLGGGPRSSLAFKSYHETRILLLQGGYSWQGAPSVAAAAGALKGQNLPVKEAVGWLLLLQLLHRRAIGVYALYEQGPQRPLPEEALISHLLGALAPPSAAAAAALLRLLQQQQQQPLSFEGFASLLLLASCGRRGPLGGPLCPLNLPALRCLDVEDGGPLIQVEAEGLPQPWRVVGALRAPQQAAEGAPGTPFRKRPQSPCPPPFKRRRLAEARYDWRGPLPKQVIGAPLKRSAATDRKQRGERATPYHATH
ncbi:hypothetical protein Efla_002330 [Eimeria flavescens]